PSVDATRISFVKNGKLAVVDINGNNQHIVDGQTVYKRILDWNKQDEYLVINKENQVYLLTKVGSKRVLATFKPSDGNFKYTKPEVLKFISKFRSFETDLKRIYTSKTPKGYWLILEDATGYIQPEILFEDANTNLAPSRMANGKVVFVSDRKSSINRSTRH
ncbi:MAG: hypothetical protein AB1489_42100, partial [Acidobacteriota bacterium]